LTVDSALNVPDLCRADSARAIADLVRSIVHARRGLSRAEVVAWVSQFVEDEDRALTVYRVEKIIDTLCELKDVGYGTIRGEPALVALPERRIALPDGTVVALGDHGILARTVSERLFPEVAGDATQSLVEVLASFGEPTSLAGHCALTPTGRWSGDDPMPVTLRRALALTGAFDPVQQKWSVSPVNASFLNEWFGLTMYNAPSAVVTPDEMQQRVAQAPARVRMVVEAGPGSGKTHVACERVISLVEREDLAPSRILLLSFTRIAVAELRDRIARRLNELPNAAALKIRTFDSFAAHLLAGVGVGSSSGHDATIRSATKLMRSDNPLVADAIAQLEHVIIDEAQDLVGDRRDMCEALLGLLSPACGVTVFGDFAQSIYGYQRKSSSDATLLEEVARRADFTSHQLRHDYRTRTEALKGMFRSVRDRLQGEQIETKDGFFGVREQICAAAVEKDIKRFEVHPSTTDGLILTRSRRSLFTAAEKMRAAGRSFRLRLPDRPARIEAWIGAILGGFPGASRISQSDFRSLFEALRPVPLRNVGECWEILRDLDASGREHISVGNIAEGLVDPPLELLRDYEGSSGPLLSTIHAIKGRESERVMLLLTPAPYGDNIDWAEEARTLYVGATRASTELRTGWISSQKLYTKGAPERHWAARADHRLVEIGLEGDLADWAAFVRSGHAGDEAEVISRIWRASSEEASAGAYPDAEGRMILRIGDHHGPAIGCLSDGLLGLIQSLRQSPPGSPPPDAVTGISVVGATTITVPGRSGEAPTLALMPLLGGFARIPR